MRARGCCKPSLFVQRTTPYLIPPIGMGAGLRLPFKRSTALLAGQTNQHYVLEISQVAKLASCHGGRKPNTIADLDNSPELLRGGAGHVSRVPARRLLRRRSPVQSYDDVTCALKFPRHDHDCQLFRLPQSNSVAVLVL